MRKPRELRAGAIYHVTARANRKEMILDNRGMKDLFLQVVARARKRYDFRIENFTLMGNHFHLMIRPGRGESLSRILQWILSVFAMAYNRIHGYVGHVWGDRFFSRIIRTFAQFLMVFEYIDRNPVEAKQVDQVWDWEYGGLWHRRTGRRDVLCETKNELSSIFPAHGLLLLESSLAM